MSWAFVQKVSPPTCSALMCPRQRRTAPTCSGPSFGCCACPTQAPNAASSALSSSRWVFFSPSPVPEPRIVWLLNGCLNWYMHGHRREREEISCCTPGFFQHMQWYRHLSFLLQCGAVLSPLTLPGCSGHPGTVPTAALCCTGRRAPHRWSSSDPSVTSACLGPLAVLLLWLLQYSWC